MGHSVLVCVCVDVYPMDEKHDQRKVSLARSDKTRPRGGGLTHDREIPILIFRFYSLHNFSKSQASAFTTHVLLSKTRSLADFLS